MDNLYPPICPFQRDDGLMRSSCTQENLRSPSVLGVSARPSNPPGGVVTSTFQQQLQQHQQSGGGGGAGNGGEDDEVATEYAESDVLLGGTGTGSNGSSSGAGSAAANNIPRY